jgi:hypothetical protein
MLNFGALSPKIFSSTLGSWDNPQRIFQKHWKSLYWVASERNQKVFYENHSIRGFFGFKSSFNTILGIFLAPLVCLKSVKYEMSGNFHVRSEGILWPQPLIRHLEVLKNFKVKNRLSEKIQLKVQIMCYFIQRCRSTF